MRSRIGAAEETCPRTNQPPCTCFGPVLPRPVKLRLAIDARAAVYSWRVTRGTIDLWAVAPRVGLRPLVPLAVRLLET